jgi:hypothetical protein
VLAAGAEVDVEMCLVTVRRDQIEALLPDLVNVIAIPQVVLMGNRANRTGHLMAVLGRLRTVLALAAEIRRLKGIAAGIVYLCHVHCAKHSGSGQGNEHHIS